MALSLYSAKKAVLYPRTVYMRRVKERDMDDRVRKMFEVNYYRKPLYAFTGATMRNPEILVDADLAADSVVLDVGAYIGAWSEKVSDRYGCTIHAFEPASVALRSAEKRLKGHANVHLHPYGLGATDQTARLSMAGPGSSTHTGSSPLGAFEDISIRDVTGVLDELGIDQVDLLKVNIEGGEFDLFDRLTETGWLPRIRQTMIQFHEFHPNPYWRRFRVRRALRRTHTEVWDYPWVWEFWQRTERVPGAPDR
jgi:FkbM family methyltransferase